MTQDTQHATDNTQEIPDNSQDTQQKYIMVKEYCQECHETTLHKEGVSWTRCQKCGKTTSYIRLDRGYSNLRGYLGRG